MHRQQKRLRLSKETLRALQPKELALAGGMPEGSFGYACTEGCSDSCRTSCVYTCAGGVGNCPSRSDCSACPTAPF